MRLYLAFLWVLSLAFAEFHGFLDIDPLKPMSKPPQLVRKPLRVKLNENSKASSPDIQIEDKRTKKMRKEKIRGVSLGGWLVLEPWINTILFEQVAAEAGKMPVDEYTFTKILGKKRSQEVLNKHWSTYYNESDFAAIKYHGLNLVRVPIGYWAFEKLDNDPYVGGQEEYLDKAINWASDNDLQVQVDIHGMPGSQNGFDNSGLRTTNPNWLEVDKNMAVTYKVVDYILEKYGNHPAVDSIEMVNEPFGIGGIDLAKLEDFYLYVYDQAREKGITKNLYFHDGFLGIGWWDWFMKDTKYENITIDHHLYEIFSTWHLDKSIEEHITNIEEQGKQMAKQYHPSIVGEFSGALTDCTKYINGVGKGARYNGTFQTDHAIGSCENHSNFSSWSDELKNNTKKFIEVQMKTFEENANGWIYWCFKTDETIEWDFQKLAQLGMLPSAYTYRPPKVNETTNTSPSKNSSGQKPQKSEATSASYELFHFMYTFKGNAIFYATYILGIVLFTNI
ncbi:uncharacterized protein PRCAT00005714001 [Priceomyces carsonii]|uniref:uncharacterized protein n=1 Tax=Priceomyces carsonii TaxID=28549 RepID=UPI002EDB8BBE|nr:unnamed protein product [Priceomyces carsonii]